MNIALSINDKTYEFDLKGNETLLEVLRNHLGFTGTKSACDEAECGACTVNINGKAVLSCIILACDLEGEKVTTIEGLSDGERLHPIQQSFLDHGAVQCGFCNPGMIMASKALLEENAEPTQDEIKRALDGNLCRCAGYLKICDAVHHAGKKIKNEKNK